MWVLASGDSDGGAERAGGAQRDISAISVWVQGLIEKGIKFKSLMQRSVLHSIILTSHSVILICNVEAFA